MPSPSRTLERVGSPSSVSAVKGSFLPYLLLLALVAWTLAQLILPRSVPPATPERPNHVTHSPPGLKTTVTNTNRSSSSSQSTKAADHSARSPCSTPAAATRLPRQHRLTPLEVPMANDQPPVLVRLVALLFGDSLTERSFDPEGGWGAALAHHFARKLDVINRGFGGYNSRWGVDLLEQVLKQVQAQGQSVALMTIWFGANDAALPERSANRQHVPVLEYGKNLEHMIKAAQSAGIHRIILLTPPPVGNEARVKHQQMRMGISDPVPPDRTLEYSKQYAEAVSDVAAKHQVPYVDIYNKLQQTEGWGELYQDDGLHFTPMGSRKVWQELKEVIQSDYPELSLDRLPNQMPWWDQWDHKHPDSYWSNTLPQLEANTQAALAAAAGKHPDKDNTRN